MEIYFLIMATNIKTVKVSLYIMYTKQYIIEIIVP